MACIGLGGLERQLEKLSCGQTCAGKAAGAAAKALPEKPVSD